jgi:RHS repeat-associated protein
MTPLNSQHTDYYAFGYTIQSSQNVIASPKNEYLYNHKELQEETGLYDYGARLYDPVIGRWTSVDMLAEKFTNWSPYVYVYDNPISLVDQDGMAPGDPRWLFYKTFGKEAIQATTTVGGANSIFKALYLIAQRRVENGFNDAPPGNNPMNIKGTGDLGQISENTHENDKKGKRYDVVDKFANFSTTQKGFDAYFELLKTNFADAYSSLQDPNKTISDFTNGLENGKNGSYATDPNYAKNIQTMFKGVKSDYLKMADAQILSDNDCMIGLMKQVTDPNISSQERSAASGEMRRLYEEKVQLDKDKKELKKLQ